MAAFGALLRQGPLRSLSALAASVLTAIGGTFAVPLPVAAAELAQQHITWNGIPDTPLTAGSVSVAAVASSGLPVSYTSTSSDVCTVDGDVVTLHRHGRCTVRATQPGNGSFAAADPASETFAVLGRAQTITWTPTPDVAVTAATVHVSATASSGLAVTFRTATPRTCKVKGGTVTLVAGGTCTVHATQPGNDDYAPAPRADDSFHIDRTGQTIRFPRPADTAMTTGTVPIEATATSGLTVTVTSRSRDVCRVSARRVTLVGAGTCVLRATQAGNGRYAAAARVDRRFTVGPGGQTIEFPSPGPVPLSTGTVTVAPTSSSGLPVTVTSAAPAVCTVEGTTVTLHAVGTCVLRAARAATGSWSAASTVEVSFPVVKGKQSITFTPPPPTARGATVNLAATATSGLPVTFTTVPAGTSAGPPVAAAGTPGTATGAPVTAAGTAGTAGTVAETPETPGTASSAPGAGAAAPAVCTVAGAVVTVHAPGACTVRATQPGDGRWEPAAPADVTFTVTGDTQTITFPAPPTTPLTDGTVRVSATATSELPITITSNTPKVCTAAGTVITLRTPGRCTLTASQPGDATHPAALDVTRTFTVARGTQRITFAQPETRSVLDGPLTVAPSTSSYLPVHMSSGTPDICTVAAASTGIVPGAGSAPGTGPGAAPGTGIPSSTGALTRSGSGSGSGGGSGGAGAGAVVTPLAAGRCVLRADQPGNGEWAPARRVTRAFRITAAAQTVTFAAPLPVAVSDGPVTLLAVASSGLPVTYSSGSPDTCSVDGATVTLLAAGGCALAAHQGGDRRFAPAPDVTTTLTILQDPAPVTVPAAAPVAAAAGRIAGADNSIIAGGAITVGGGGYQPGTAVEVLVYSTPESLGTAYADAAGTFTLLVVVPSGLHRGGHTLVAAGLAADNTVRYLTVPVAVRHPAALLPVTGGPVGTVAALGSWAVLIGTVLALLGRRGLSRYRWLYRFVYRPRHAV